MPTINNILTVLSLISFLLMIGGLIKPGWVLRWAKQKTKLRALTLFGGLCFSLAVAASVIESPAIKQVKQENHRIARGKISAAIQIESQCAIEKNKVGGTEKTLLQFLQKNGFRKQNSLYLHHPDASHPQRPYVALAYKFDSTGLKFFQLDNWYSDPQAAATIPASISMKLESMETSLLTELLGTDLGNRLASVRRELISSESGDVFSMNLSGRELYGFVTSGGGSIVFMDDESPLGSGRYRKKPKRIT